ncbi:MAG: GNAT family N-acetyltransferase [Pseudomonadota bacterium]
MPDQVVFRDVSDPASKSRACHAITLTIPQCFGQADANAKYRAGIVDKPVFAAFLRDRPVGAIALRFHDKETAEIWWLGMRSDQQCKGIGSRLLEMAFDHARQAGCHNAVLMTVSEKSADPYYASTRAFYRSHGFLPLVGVNEDDRHTPMMWMIRPLGSVRSSATGARVPNCP